jgi:hypothetical protein
VRPLDLAVLGEGVGEHRHLVALVVEGEHQLAHHQRHVRQAERVGVRLAQRFDGPYEVVAEEADCAAWEGRQIAQPGDSEASGQLRREPVGVAFVAEPPAQGRVWPKAEERVAAEPAVLGGFEQEGGPPERLPQLQERRDGRLAVVDERLPQRHDVRLAGQLAGALDVGLDRGRPGTFSGDGH